jgi:hypothetical protein
MTELTPEQQEKVRQAKAAGEKRVTLTFTPEQKAEWEAAVRDELAGKEENIAHFRKIKAAAEQRGFFGDVRRAIALSRRPVHELASEIGVDSTLLSGFRAGDAELPPAALDRLIETLGLRLIQETPRRATGSVDIQDAMPADDPPAVPSRGYAEKEERTQTVDIMCPKCGRNSRPGAVHLGDAGYFRWMHCQSRKCGHKWEIPVTQWILSRVGHETTFKYPGDEGNKCGILKERSVVDSVNVPGTVPYWDVVDLIAFPEEAERNWLRIGYYRAPNERLNWGSQTTITEPISVWKRILANAAKNAQWFRKILLDAIKDSEE